MRKLILFALCACLLLASSVALAAEPINQSDIDAMSNTGCKTMQDYIDRFSPFEYSWYFEGEATGESIFTLGVEGGSLTLSVTDATDYQDDEEGLLGTDKLEGPVLAMDARLIGAYWDDDSFTLPLPRGLAIGSTKAELEQAIGDLEIASLEPGEYEDYYDETANCVLSLPEGAEEPFEYYGFDFFLMEGKINQAQYWYYTESE